MFFFLLPYKVNRAFKEVPLLTILLIAVNTLFYFGTSVDLESTVKYLGFVPNIHGLYTWFTSMFLHGDFFSHLLWNMYFLWLFGALLEDVLGKLKFSLIYLTSGLVACLVHAGIIAIFVPGLQGVPLIGASGAIAGLLGVFAVRFYKNKISIAYFVFILFFVRWGVIEITSVAALSIWVGRELLSGLLQIGGLGSPVAHWAHIGGFVFGVIVALSFRLVGDADVEYLSEEADSWARMGIHSGAFSRYTQLIENTPKDPEVYRKLAGSMLFSGDGNKEEIIQNCMKAIRLFLQNQQKQEAMGVYQELNDAYSGVVLDAKTQFALGSINETQADFRAAADAYFKLIENDPDCPEAEKASFRLAHVYLKMGNEEEANRTWQQFVEKYPSSQWIPFADCSFAVKAGG